MAKKTAVVAKSAKSVVAKSAAPKFDSPIVHSWVAKGARIERDALRQALQKMARPVGSTVWDGVDSDWVRAWLDGRAKRTVRKGGVGRLVLALAILLGATAASAAPITGVINGDFTQGALGAPGALGFDTDYVQVDYTINSLAPDGVFGVAPSAAGLHSSWTTEGGVGGAEDPFMLVNTKTGGPSLIWGEDVPVTSGWDYVFGFFLRNLYPAGGAARAPQVTLLINGVDHGVFGPGGASGWVGDQLIFQATSADARIEFWSAVWMYTGADLGLDRITLARPEENLPTPEPITLLMLGSGLALLGVGVRGKRGRRPGARAVVGAVGGEAEI